MSAASDRSGPVAETKLGSIRGVRKDDMYIFRGIRYAEAERCMMPRSPRPWKGLYDATYYRNTCPEMATPVNFDNYRIPRIYMPMDENCQFLNIWTRELYPEKLKPVMVWLHGGGLVTGSSIETFSQDGENLAKRGDVVVVSVGHRLNCAGFLDLSAFGEKYHDSGIVGLADLVEALRWIHSHINAFGGDPDNVTLFGQSGGGSKVLFLMQTPAADGLFRRAIIESGGMKYAEPPSDATLKEMTVDIGRRTVELLGLNADCVDEIADVSYWELASAADQAAKDYARAHGMTAVRWAPADNKDYCYGHPIPDGWRPDAPDVPLICGTTFGEHFTNYYVHIGDGNKNRWTDATTDEHAKKQFGCRADDVKSAFREAYPEKPSADCLFVDRFDRRVMNDFARERCRLGQKLWNYVFALESKLEGGLDAWHFADVAYVFHNAEYLWASYEPGAYERVQDVMCDCWLAFAKNGDPNHENIEEWHASEPNALNTMIFDRDIRCKTEFDTKLQSLFQAMEDEKKRGLEK